MANCSMCGNSIPDGQDVCSMCYGDPGYGRDGYYEAWLANQEQLAQQKREQEQQFEDMNTYEEAKTADEATMTRAEVQFELRQLGIDVRPALHKVLLALKHSQKESRED